MVVTDACMGICAVVLPGSQAMPLMGLSCAAPGGICIYCGPSITKHVEDGGGFG